MKVLCFSINRELVLKLNGRILILFLGFICIDLNLRLFDLARYKAGLKSHACVNIQTIRIGRSKANHSKQLIRICSFTCAQIDNQITKMYAF